jgi:cytochrome c-type biogenesis protein
MLSVHFTLITGLSFKDLEGGSVPATLRWTVVARTLAFVAAFTIVFVAAGAVAGGAGRALGAGLTYFNWLGGLVVILFGLHLMGLVRRPLDRLLGHIGFDYRRVTRRPGLATAFLVGLIFAVVCSHCIAYTLYSLLMVAGTTGSAAVGARLLAAFSIGLALPYLAVGYSLGAVIGSIRGLVKYRRAVSFAAGLLMLAFGLAVLSGRFTDLSGRLSPWIGSRPRLGM